MQAVVINYYDNKTKLHTGSEYYIDGKQLDLLAYRKKMEEYECAEDNTITEQEIYNNEQSEIIALGLAELVNEAIEDTLEMFDNPNACEHCKAEQLLNLILLGQDAAMNGCVLMVEEE